MYELWDYDTGNCVGAYAETQAALVAVRDTTARYGESAAYSLVLLMVPDGGDSEQIAAGARLIAPAEASISTAISPALNP